MKPKDLIPIRQCVSLFPVPPRLQSVYKWCRDGIKTRDGQRVHLHTVRSGGRIFLTEKDVKAFVERINEQNEVPSC